MKLTKHIVIFLNAMILMGCARTIVYVRTDAVISSPVTMADSISVELPDQPTAIEQNVAKVVKEELIANGFNFQENDSIIRMVVSVNRQTTNYGYESTNFAGTLYTNTHNVDETFAYLTAYRSDDPQKAAVWNGLAKTRADFFQSYIHSVIKQLLEKYGQNSDWWENIDYTYKPWEW